MSPVPSEGWVHRAPRPLMGWGGVLLIVVCLLFLVVLAAIATFAMWRWANGQPIDLMGFAAVLGQATAAGAAIWSLVKRFMIGREMQRADEIRTGQSVPPFVPPPPSSPTPEGGVVNTGALNNQ